MLYARNAHFSIMSNNAASKTKQIAGQKAERNKGLNAKHKDLDVDHIKGTDTESNTGNNTGNKKKTHHKLQFNNKPHTLLQEALPQAPSPENITLADIYAQMKLGQDQTNKRLDLVDQRLDSLNNYNRNRDKEFELIVFNRFIQELENNGWNATEILSSKLYNKTTGIIELEWDGIVLAEHQNRVPVLFVFETKQVFDFKRYTEYLSRLVKMRDFVLPDVLSERDEKGSLQKKDNPTKEFQRLLGPLDNKFVVKGVVASSSLPIRVLKAIRAANDSSVVISSGEKYLVEIRV
jgi:hypothetical protein